MACVPGGAHIERVLHTKARRNPKVAYPRMLISREQYIRRLDVAMRDALRVQIVEASGHLDNDPTVEPWRWRRLARRPIMK